MKYLFFLLALLIAVSATAQDNVKTFKVDPTKSRVWTLPDAPEIAKKEGIAIDKLNQADIKALDEAMKPLEDYVREYNRLAGLKGRIYQTLVKSHGIDIRDYESLKITADSIKFLTNK